MIDGNKKGYSKIERYRYRVGERKIKRERVGKKKESRTVRKVKMEREGKSKTENRERGRKKVKEIER